MKRTTVSLSRLDETVREDRDTESECRYCALREYE